LREGARGRWAPTPSLKLPPPTPDREKIPGKAGPKGPAFPGPQRGLGGEFVGRAGDPLVPRSSPQDRRTT